MLHRESPEDFIIIRIYKPSLKKLLAALWVLIVPVMALRRWPPPLEPSLWLVAQAAFMAVTPALLILILPSSQPRRTALAGGSTADLCCAAVQGIVLAAACALAFLGQSGKQIPAWMYPGIACLAAAAFLLEICLCTCISRLFLCACFLNCGIMLYGYQGAAHGQPLPVSPYYLFGGLLCGLISFAAALVYTRIRRKLEPLGRYAFKL